MLKKIQMTFCASAFVLATFAVAAPALADEVTLSGASCFPIGSPFTLTQKMSKGVYDVVG